MAWFSRLFSGAKRAGNNPEALDQQTRLHLARAGGNLTKPTDVVNYLYAKDEAGAMRAASELRVQGYAVEVRPAATGSTWLARANRQMIPSEENIAQMRVQFESIASLVGGEYDGWEAAVTQ